MSDIIHLLPDHIANQIAAGEVIQRPASVVKELMENAVDAGAMHITVHIKEAGRALIQVIDDGKGMSETDARMAFERHATSKIAAAEDLFSLRTMGFRGEALPSIAAVAQVELRTRARGAELGTRLTIEGSELIDIGPDACPEGAIFSVKNLFFNVPARRKFLKSNETEFRNIMTEFERVVLANPTLTFRLVHNDAEVMNLPAAPTRRRIVDVFGKHFNQRLLPVETTTSLVKIEGFIGRIDTVRRRGYRNYFFVNGRYMRHPYFHKAVTQAYERLTPPGELPDYFIYLTLDPAGIDVNIHPTKTEIKFENEQPIWQILAAAVREALGKFNAVPSIDFDTEGALDIPIYNPAADHTAVKQPAVEVNPHYNPFRSAPLAPDRNWEKLYQDFTNESSSPTPDAPAAPLFPEPAAAASACFQYKNRYILTALKSGLAMIDQYRAHVRILYDRYVRNVREHTAVSQKLLFPELVELTPTEAALLPSLLDGLHCLGFELSAMGGNSYSVTAVPSGLRDVKASELLKELVDGAADTPDAVGDEMAEALALSLARSAAIRPGRPLTTEEMEEMVATLFSTESNRITPDGKPVLILLTDDELATRFR
ncbi:DNA mismatch repair protein MutL [Tannerella sp. oral taxon 808]|nr:DNA mismatch repair protein MutL [Tannerella sp. oral taxon 808]